MASLSGLGVRLRISYAVRVYFISIVGKKKTKPGDMSNSITPDPTPPEICSPALLQLICNKPGNSMRFKGPGY
jgi:hypothetical protein